MITIEQHQQEREAILSQMKELHKQLIEKDLSFWKKTAQQLFTQYPELETLSWGQGFFYNDENYAFEITDFEVNGLEMKYEYYHFRPKYISKYTGFNVSKLYLVHKENDKDENENFGMRRYKEDNEKDDIIQKLQTKYQSLMKPAVAFAQILNDIETNLGSRHFADIFGKKAKVIFSREGLTIEDYEDSDAGWDGILEELI